MECAMKKSLRRVTALSGIIALLAAASVTIAPATPTNANGCERAKLMMAIFPSARTVGFNTRSPVRHHTTRRAPKWPGWCADWTASYADLPDQKLRPFRAFAEFRVSLYKTHEAALVALAEPLYGPRLVLPHGVLMRTLVDNPSVNGDASRQVGAVASVVGNVFISSIGQGRPPAHYGIQAVRAQTRIHHRIHAALSTSVSGAPSAWPTCAAPFGTPDRGIKVVLNICGPKYVIRGVNYNYTVVVANRGQTTYRRITLSVIHEDPITRSSIPYRSYRPDCATWRLAKVKPNKTLRVSFRLPFKQHGDPKGSNFTVDLRADRRSCVGGLTKDVTFVNK
jgi:hypothetical protein